MWNESTATQEEEEYLCVMEKVDRPHGGIGLSNDVFRILQQ